VGNRSGLAPRNLKQLAVKYLQGEPAICSASEWPPRQAELRGVASHRCAEDHYWQLLAVSMCPEVLGSAIPPTLCAAHRASYSSVNQQLGTPVGLYLSGPLHHQTINPLKLSHLPQHSQFSPAGLLFLRRIAHRPNRIPTIRMSTTLCQNAQRSATAPEALRRQFAIAPVLAVFMQVASGSEAHLRQGLRRA
jgi:hypothetical protein